jgi:hypothetical protein
VNRREIIAGIASAAALPVAAWAQQRERMWQVGMLLSGMADDMEFQAFHGASLQGLSQAGWIIGRLREIIAGLGSAAAWPVVARAQQSSVPVIGWLGLLSADDNRYMFAFLQGLPERGDRIPLGGGPTRSAAGACRRSRPSPRSDNPSRQLLHSFGGEGSDHDHTDRLCHRR